MRVPVEVGWYVAENTFAEVRPEWCIHIMLPGGGTTLSWTTTSREKAQKLAEHLFGTPESRTA